MYWKSIRNQVNPEEKTVAVTIPVQSAASGGVEPDGNPELVGNLSKMAVKDELVIRNSDSGKGTYPFQPFLFLISFLISNYWQIKKKVMGMKGKRVHLIEEISDTVISFQRGTPSLPLFLSSGHSSTTKN